MSKQTDRREFLKKTGISLLAGMALSSLPGMAYTPSLPDYRDDEDYWKQVRQLFPLAKNKIYMNNGTLGPSPYQVIDAVSSSMHFIDTTGDYGGWEESRPKIAEFLGVDGSEISLTHNVSEGINIVCWGVDLKKGDEVIITDNEHVGNALPWLNRAKIDGVKLRVLQLQPTAAETMNRLNSLITKKTRVIAIPHIPCTNGQVLPVKDICSLASSKNILTFIDGAHGPGMLNMNLRELGCDFYASCFHKWMLGPKGTGFLYVKQSRLDQLQAYFVGAGSTNGWTLAPSGYNLDPYTSSAHRYDYGSQSTALYNGVTTCISFMQEIGMDKVEGRVRYLSDRLYKQLQEQQTAGKLKIATPEEQISRAGMVSFEPLTASVSSLNNLLREADIRVRVVNENNLNLIRISTHIYNQPDELDKLMEVVKKS